MRMTADVPAPILDELKQLQATEGGSLSDVVSRFLADALARQRTGSVESGLNRNAKAMQTRVGLTDKEAVHVPLQRGSPLSGRAPR